MISEIAPMESTSATNESGSMSKTSSKQPRLIACRECHRSKLRCDREYPCKSCIKRGCADICPNGILVKKERPKASAVSAATLQGANDRLNDRVRVLEEALAASHSQLSSEPHPLLTDRLYLSDPQAKPHGAEQDSSQNADGWDDETASISAQGTLTFGTDGRATFHGIAANPEALLESETRESTSQYHANFSSLSSLPPELVELASMFPFGTPRPPSPSPDLKAMIITYLPSADKAWYLCDAWFENGAWLHDPVPRAEFVTHIFNPIYKSSSIEEISSDLIAVFFITLALGSLLDLRQPFDHSATEPLFQLSCAAFCLEPIFKMTTIPSIQALHLILVYLYTTNRQNLEYRWLTSSLLSRLLESSGLLRKSQHWTDNPQENERRCRTFWESYSLDVWQSFDSGRSPALSALHIQCQLPLDVDQSNAGTNSTYSTWKYQYRHRCLVPIMDEAFAAKAPNHATILRLDRKIRDFEVPELLRSPGPNGLPPPSFDDTLNIPPHLALQRHAVFCERELTLLHLHRSYLALALQNSPTNPLGNKYAASVFATYRSASLIVSATQDLTLKHSELVSRIWAIWSAVFSAATVLGNIVIRSPNCQLSSSALVELGVATTMLETRTVRSRAARVVPVVKQLKEKAEVVYRQYTTGNNPEARRPSPSNTQLDDISTFNSHSRFNRLSRTVFNPSHPHSRSTSGSASPSEAPTPESYVSLPPYPPSEREYSGMPEYSSINLLDQTLTSTRVTAASTSLSTSLSPELPRWKRLDGSQDWTSQAGTAQPSHTGSDYDTNAPIPFHGLTGPPSNYGTWDNFSNRYEKETIYSNARNTPQ
ncbi:hypothetical protein K439DRAFT_1627524 [Ramaria rubella]|nr:hypothetical protein K439DRAFT_1627524 [Ramaria rubella]